MSTIIAGLIAGIATVLAALIGRNSGALPAGRGPRRLASASLLLLFVGGGLAGGLAIQYLDRRLEEAMFRSGMKLPVGTVIAYMGNIPPDGWLLCDGKPIPAAFVTLRTLLRSDNMPNLQGRFLRGLDPSGAIDPDGTNRTLGSIQGDLLKKHQHKYLVVGVNPEARLQGGDRGYYSLTQSGDTDQNSDGGVETRPKNLATHFLIKH